MDISSLGRVPHIIKYPSVFVQLVKGCIEEDVHVFEKVYWNGGDEYVYGTSLKFGNVYGFYLTNAYRFLYKNKDLYSGSLGYHYEELSNATEATLHTYEVQLGFSTIEFFKKKKFRL